MRISSFAPLLTVLALTSAWAAKQCPYATPSEISNVVAGSWQLTSFDPQRGCMFVNHAGEGFIVGVTPHPDSQHAADAYAEYQKGFADRQLRPIAKLGEQAVFSVTADGARPAAAQLVARQQRHIVDISYFSQDSQLARRQLEQVFASLAKQAIGRLPR
ncbi:hypothetical protein [Chitinimonas lacunae]|uniref:Uncharacterized protein n=1 Tax=Chitinimonas lacunae TaxID=1963018 RepID=A0ABV8MUC0_9NEIS